ncbi:MAG: hypothetical protein DLM67_03300 [Candidatus Nephthysia bennettiae]|nr:MAG: hypothetical protein DLM67_03300 [Candidatus Dormibacteraeota bacterium]
MPSVIYETLIDNATALPPGGRIDSKVIDVRGADRVSVNVSITNVDANVQRTIYFGPTTNNAVAPLRTDSFANSNHLLTSVPVCGPELYVVVENHGTQQWTCDGTVYALREVP